MAIPNKATSLGGLALRLVRDKLLSSADAEHVQAEAVSNKVSFVSRLVESKKLDGGTVARIASEEFGVPLFQVSALDLEVAHRDPAHPAEAPGGALQALLATREELQNPGSHRSTTDHSYSERRAHDPESPRISPGSRHKPQEAGPRAMPRGAPLRTGIPALEDGSELRRRRRRKLH